MNFSKELNKGIKVFSQLYVGVRRREGDRVPLGFATPLENNSAGLKRQETVNKWVKECIGYELNPDGTYKRDANGHIVRVVPENSFFTLDNTARTGFKITDDIKRLYWGGGNVVWRVEDPAGFELEIQSQNLMAIIQSTSIVNGEIQGKCMWGRDGGSNILLHENADEFKNAIVAAENLKSVTTVAKSEIIPGTLYLLKSGNLGYYMGKYFVTEVESIAHPSPNVWRGDSAKIEHTIGQPVEYDVIRAVGFNVRAGVEEAEYILYKKAALVRPITEEDNSGKPLMLKPSDMRQVLNPTFCGFAGNGKNSYSIVSVLKRKPKQQVFNILPMTSESFREQFTRFEKSVRRQAPQLIRAGIDYCLPNFSTMFLQSSLNPKLTLIERYSGKPAAFLHMNYGAHALQGVKHDPMFYPEFSNEGKTVTYQVMSNEWRDKRFIHDDIKMKNPELLFLREENPINLIKIVQDLFEQGKLFEMCVVEPQE